MKSPGSLACLAALALALESGCGQVASSNPLAASLAPPPAAACPVRYGFEGADAAAGWSAPSWPGGFVGLAPDGTHAHCGAQALRLRLDLKGGAGGRSAVIQRMFPQLQALSGATRQLWVYFEQAPPASLRVVAVFLGQDLMWKSPAPDNKSGFSAGWNLMSGTISTPQAAGFLIQIDMTAAAAWAGDLWIDDINW